MWKRIFAVLFIVLLFVAGYYFGRSGDSKNDVIKRTRIILGTTVEVLIRNIPDDKSGNIFESAFREFSRTDSVFSTYIPGNPIHKFNNSKNDTVVLGEEITNLLKLSGEMNTVCRGGFDITLGRLNDLWGFSGQNPSVPSEDTLEKVLSLTGWKYIQILNNSTVLKLNDVHLNLNAIAKGYAVDRACKILKDLGVEEFLINAGGEIRASGKDWNIGIQDPDNRNLIIASLKPSENSNEISVATSGDYENYFIKDSIRYHHIFDPLTGYPARKCRSVTIIAKDVTTADALATGIFAAGPEQGLEITESLEGVECYIIEKSGKIFMSSGFGKYLRKYN